MAVIASAVHENGTDKDKMAHARRCGASRKMQRTLGIDNVVKLGRGFLARVMYTRGEMHYRLDAVERGAPIGYGSDRIDQNLVVVPGQPSKDATDSPSLARQRGRKVLTHETARSC
jgi:hypothetical protein